MASYREHKVGRKLQITATIRIPGTFSGPIAAASFSQTFSRRPEAERWAADTMDAIKRGHWKDPRLEAAPRVIPTLSQLLTGYQKWVTPKKKGAAQETTLINRLLRTSLAPMKANTITKSDIARYRDGRLAEGAAASTVHNEINTLSAVFGWAWHDENMIDCNPVADFKAGGRARRAMPAKAPGRDRRLAEGEEEALLSALADGADGPQMIALFDVGVATGARLSEILSFSRAWRDKDTIRLPDTKNGTSRIVVLSAAACAALDALPRRDDARYFTLDVPAVEYRWKVAREKAKKALIAAAVERGEDTAPIVARASIRFHDLRHEALSRMVRACDGNIKILMQQSGHRDVAMLMRYINPTIADVRAMIERLERMQALEPAAEEEQAA